MLNIFSFNNLPLTIENQLDGFLIIIVVFLALVSNLINLCCAEILPSEWFAVLDALMFSTLCTIAVLSTTTSFHEDSIALFISLVSAFSLLVVNYLSKAKVDSNDCATFNNSSMGSADFVYDDGGVEDPEMGMAIIDNYVEGFRVRMDKLPEKKCKYFGDQRGKTETITWNDFQDVEHLIDSSSCHIYVASWKGKKVILKLIKADRVNSVVAVSEFETEVSVLSRLNHGNIVRFLGSGFEPRRFIVLEYLEGGTLSNALGMRQDNSKWKSKNVHKHKFTYLQSLNLVRSLASAMDYLHTQWHDSVSVLHRDLKPDNIGFTANGILKVFDFGLCVCIKSNLSEKKANYLMTGNTGTLRYMAPEVALGDNYNQSVDVYSFGIITWQILKGQIPFEEMNKKTFFDKVVRGKVRPAFDRWWPIKLRNLLERCWHDDYSKRPSFTEIVLMLDELIEKNKSYCSLFCIQLNIPVTFSNGLCCIDPEFVARNRLGFVFGILLAVVTGIILCSFKHVVWGALLTESAIFTLYILVYLSWDYWPSNNARQTSKANRSSRFWCWPCSWLRGYEVLERDMSMGSSVGKGAEGFISPMHHSSGAGGNGGGVQMVSKRSPAVVMV